MKKEINIKKEIRRLVKEYYLSRQTGSAFVPGKSAINYAGRVYDEKEILNLVEAALEFWLTAGHWAKEFEEKLARFLGVKYCLLTNSGSSANLLAVTALTSPLLKDRRLQPGDEVITTACGFPTTLNPILQNLLVPVFVDVEPGTYNIQTEKIEKAVSRKTKAIFVAHTLGNPANLGKILRICRKRRLWLIEDNCDALGSKYQGKYTGTFGDISTASFYPAHHLTMGEGGAVLTSNPLLKKIVLSLRDWGRDCSCQPGQDNACGRRFTQKFGSLPAGYDHKYVYSHIGYNLKITDLQAAIGVAQLDKLPRFIAARKHNFRLLFNHLKKYQKYLLLPRAEENSDPAWFGFPVLVKSEAPFPRADIVNFLEKNKIATRMLFGGNLLRQPAYRGIKFRTSGGLANTDLVASRLFWLGVYPGITEAKLKYMLSIFDRFMERFI